MKLAPSRVSLNNSIRNNIGNTRKLKVGSNVGLCRSPAALGSQTPLAQSWDPSAKSPHRGARAYSSLQQHLPKELGPPNGITALNKKISPKGAVAPPIRPAPRSQLSRYADHPAPLLDINSHKFDIAPATITHSPKTLGSTKAKAHRSSFLASSQPNSGMPALSRIESEGRDMNNDTNSIVYTEATHITSFADLQVQTDIQALPTPFASNQNLR